MSFGKFKEQKPAEPVSGGSIQDSSKMHEFVKANSEGVTKAYLSKGTKITGKICFDGPAEIDGQIEGDLASQSLLTIGKTATVKAGITGHEVVVFGTVQGDIKASKRLALKQPAQVVGNISAPLISIEEGVAFQGNCRMEGPPEPARE